MEKPKHKGSEFSNISQVWQQNERGNTPQEGNPALGTEFSNITEVWQQNENAANTDTDSNNETEGKDLDSDQV